MGSGLAYVPGLRETRAGESGCREVLRAGGLVLPMAKEPKDKIAASLDPTKPRQLGLWVVGAGGHQWVHLIAVPGERYRNLSLAQRFCCLSPPA